MKLTKTKLKEIIREELKNLQEKKTWYYNIGRGVYIMGVDSYKIDKSKEAKNGYPNADHLLSSTKQASDWVTKKNNIKEGKLYEAKTIKYKKNDWKKYNKLVKKGKSVMIQTAFGDEFSWEDGSVHGVFASENNGNEIELSHDDIDKIVVY